MPLEQWQLHLLGLLNGDNIDVIPLKDVDSVLIFLNKFEPQQDDFATKCANQCGNETIAKTRILKLLDLTLLENENDILRIFGRESFADKSRKTLKTRYQRLCRVFHPDHGLADHHFLNRKMSIINSSYDLAETNFDNPFVIVGDKASKQKTFTSASATKFSDKHYSGKRVSSRKRRKPRNILGRIFRKLVKYLYLIDDFFRGPGSPAKNLLRVVIGAFVFIFCISAYQFIVSGVGEEKIYIDSQMAPQDSVRSKHSVVSQPFEKELQVSEIEKLLDEMLKENSTKSMSANLQPEEQYVDDDHIESPRLEAENTVVASIHKEPQISKPESRRSNKFKKMTPNSKTSKPLPRLVEIQKEAYQLSKKQPEVNVTQLVLPKAADRTVTLFEHFYAQSQSKNIASLFTNDGSFFEFSGKKNIENSVQRLFDRLHGQRSEFKVVSAKQAGQWLVLDSEMIIEYQFKASGDWVKKNQTVEIILFFDGGDNFLISSVTKK